MTAYQNPTSNALTVPAPYEISQNPTNTYPAQAYARGGSTKKHKGLIAAHVNPQELNIMDHLQGHQEHGPGGVRIYSHLEEILKNPHLSHAVHKHAHHNKRQHHASGGDIERLKTGGRYGDTEIAMIGPHTHHLFNQLAGHATRNPNTGHPEYYDITGALSGLWNTFKGVAAPAMSSIASNVMPAVKNIAQAAAPALIPMAQQALGNQGLGGQIAGAMLPAVAQQALGPAPQEMNPYYSAIGQGLGQAAQSYSQGAAPSQAFGQGMQYAGQQLGGGIGGGLQAAGNALNQGQGWNQAARAGGQRLYDESGGRQGLYNAGRNVGLGGVQGGWGGARQAFGNEMSNYAQRMMPRPANQQRFPRYAPQQQYSSPYDSYEEDYNPYQVYG